MSSSMLAIVFTFFLALLVNAELYVVDPQSGSACTGGQPCTVTWLEDGSAPLLPSIGLASVGLYTGQQQLIQALEPVDVSTVRAFTFTPNPAAGPNSGAYYIGFVSANPVDGSQIYRAYSPWFRLEGMTGSFESPLPSATVPISISIPPSGSASARPTTSLSTITVGTLSSAEPIPTPGASSSSQASASSSLETSSESGSSTSASEAPSSSAAPSSSGFVTSRTPAPTTSRASTTSEDTASASETPDDGSSACSTPVSNRVAIFVTLVGALAFFL